MKDLWVVSVQRSHDIVCEISVVRSSFPHGMQSIGWRGHNKIIVAANDFYVERLATMLIDVANKYCELLNSEIPE